jgi:hypothetical protein
VDGVKGGFVGSIPLMSSTQPWFVGSLRVIIRSKIDVRADQGEAANVSTNLPSARGLPHEWIATMPRRRP